jgi:hypothetical protein
MGSMVDDVQTYGRMRANAVEVHEDYYWDRIYRRAVDGLGSSPKGSRSGNVPDVAQCEAAASGWQGSELRG